MRGSKEKTKYLVNACIIVPTKKCYITFKLEISQLKRNLLTILLFPNVVLQVKYRY